jgi:hypothetical protein
LTQQQGTREEFNMPTCLNLNVLFGKRFRISNDSAAITPSERKNPWMMTIPCRRGAVIYPHGGNLLAVELDYRPHMAKRLASIPGVRLHQDGDHERTLLFPVELFLQVAALVKPRRKRRLSPQQKAENARRLALFRKKSAAQSRISTLEPSIPV